MIQQKDYFNGVCVDITKEEEISFLGSKNTGLLAENYISEILKESGYKFKKNHRIRCENTSVIPDFYLPEIDIILEIKSRSYTCPGTSSEKIDNIPRKYSKIMKVDQYKNTKVIVVLCAFEVVNKTCKEIVDSSSGYAKDFLNLCKKYNVKEWVNCGDLLKILPKKVKPFIKWVGGKKKLVDRIIEEFPICIGTYHEPFVGGGSMLFSINRDCKKKISDINKKLVNCYIVVKNKPEELIQELSSGRYSNDKDTFYKIREIFNSVMEDSIVSAAMFIYLNKCCFNGMYRENKNGHYNVPFGRMKNPLICDAKLIRNVSEYLQNVEIECKSYESIDTKQGDLVYLDPPYHNTFADYNKTGFLEEDHVKLKLFVDKLVKAGVSVVLSNSNTEFITNLYKEYNISIIDTKYSVGATSSSSRQEVLITKICHSEPAI